MRNVLSLLTIIIIGLTACTKNNTLSDSNPASGFGLTTAYSSNDTSQIVKVAVYEGFQLVNTSANADSYLWDFGNGTNSTDKEPAGGYTKSGTYTLTLTAFKDGRKSVTSKIIKVVDPVAKHIVVTSLNPRSALGWAATYPTGVKMDVWVEILRKATPDQQYSLSNYGIPLAPLVHKTAVIANVDASKLPLIFAISDKFVIDIPTFASGSGYIINLYVRDNTDTYLVASSYGSGITSSMTGDVVQNRFTITTGFEGSNISLRGDYE